MFGKQIFVKSWLFKLWFFLQYVHNSNPISSIFSKQICWRLLCFQILIQPVNKTITKRVMKWWRENLNFGTRGYSLSQIFISGHRNSQFLSLLNQVFVSFTRLSLMIMTKVTPIFTYSGCHTCKLHNRHHIIIYLIKTEKGLKAEG